MADVFTLTPQPIRLTATGRQPVFLSVDVSAYDSLDVEAVCAVEGTATNAALNLFTGMQTDTDDGWLVPSSNFAPINGTGQQVTRVTLGAGLLQYLRWDVSSLGGATSLTFFIRGVARTRVGGGASTLAADYASGASQNDSTIALDSIRLGVRVRDNATPVSGALLQVQDSAGATNYVNINSGGTQSLLSGMADGASAVAGVINTVAAWANATAKLFSFRNNGTEKLAVLKDGTLLAPAALGMQAGAATSTEWITMNTASAATAGDSLLSLKDNGTSQIRLRSLGSSLYSIAFGPTTGDQIFGGTGILEFQVNNATSTPLTCAPGGTYPGDDLATALGIGSHRWSSAWCRQYFGVEQTVAAAATITLNPASGEYIRVTLGATGITTVNAGSGSAGEIMTTAIIQDATGGRTISGWSSSFVFAGGAYTATSTANKRDLITWRWDATASKWYEMSRAMNL